MPTRIMTPTRGEAASGDGGRGGGRGGGDSFLSTLAALRASITGAPASTTTRNSTLTSEPAPISITQSALEGELIGLRSDLAASRSALGTTLASHEQVVQTLRREIDEAHRAQKAAEEGRAAVEVQRKAAAERTDEMQRQLSVNSALRQTLEEKVGRLESELTETQSDTDRKMTNLDRALASTGREREEALRRAGKSEAEVLSLQRRVEEMERDLTRQRATGDAERAKLEGGIATLEQSLQTTRGRQEEEVRRSARVQEQTVQELRKDLMAALDEARECQSQAERSQSEAEELGTKLQTTKAERDAFEKKITELVDQIADRDEIIDKCRGETDEVRKEWTARLEEAEAALEEARADTEKAGEAMEIEEKALEEKLGAKDKELADARGKLEEARGLAEKNDKLTKSYKKQSELIQKKLVEATKALRDREAELKTAKEEVVAAREAAAEVDDDDGGASTAEIEALQKELADIKSQLETKQTELSDANDRASKAAESAAAATAAAAAADKKANKAGKTKPTAADKMKDEQIERLTEELADKEDELECAEEEVKRLKEKVEGVSRSDVLCSFLVSFPLLPIQYSHNIYHIYPHLYVLCHSGSSRIRLLQIQQPKMLPHPTLLSASRTSFLKPATKLLP